MISIKEITHENKQDINILNQPFPLIGRLIPSYQNQALSSQAVLFESTEWVTFPDENYDFEQIQDSHIFIGAYDDNKCVGLAILQKPLFKYIYLHDLKVGFEIGGLDTRGYKGTAQEGKADIYFYLDCD